MLSRAASIAGHYKSIFAYYYQRRLSFRKPESRSLFMQIITPLFQADQGFALLAQLFNIVRVKRLDHRSISTSGHLRHLLMNLHFRSADPLMAKHNKRQRPLSSHAKRRICSMSLFVCLSCCFHLKKLVKKRLTIDIIFAPRMEIFVLNVNYTIALFRSFTCSSFVFDVRDGTLAFLNGRRLSMIATRKTKANCLLNGR